MAARARDSGANIVRLWIFVGMWDGMGEELNETSLFADSVILSMFSEGAVVRVWMALSLGMGFPEAHVWRSQRSGLQNAGIRQSVICLACMCVRIWLATMRILPRGRVWVREKQRRFLCTMSRAIGWISVYEIEVCSSISDAPFVGRQ